MNIKPKPLLLIFIGLIILFTLLSILIAQHPILSLDIKVSNGIQKIHSDALDKIMLAISIFGEIPYSLLSVLLIAGVFFYYKYRREAYFIALTLFSGLIILGIKNLVNRPRPTSFYVRLVGINRFQSFPSGHVLSYTLFFGFLIVLMRHMSHLSKGLRQSLILISMFLIVSISPSRIYLGAHWFTDTLGGFILGIICLIPLSYYYLQPKKSFPTGLPD